MEPPYDSTNDTEMHIQNVQLFIIEVLANLRSRADVHDQSKLVEPEKSAFDILTPRLKFLKYGSAEYRASLKELKPALDHHYALNDHHPEHYPGEAGVMGMSLMAVIEMLCDWRAAGLRHDPPNSIASSIAHNSVRFNISPELTQILYNTARELGWTKT